MATYKQPCIKCGEMLEKDSRFCGKCGSNAPFGHLCPFCLRPANRDYTKCPGCGQLMMTTCPLCKGQTFRGNESCDKCGKSLMIKCMDKRCGVLQYFEVTKCTACGKAIKKGSEQLKGR
jgi:predicted amidophosphoribosyltransferase